VDSLFQVILVTGATGHVGSSVVASLSQAEAPCRALVRSPERADDLRGYDTEIAVGDFSEPESLDDALRGVTAALLVAPPGPQQVAWETAFIDAAARAPLPPHIVKVASIGAAPDAPYQFGRTHGQIIETLRSSGVPHTVLAPNGYLQNLEAQAVSVARDGVLAIPGGDAVVSHIDVRDVAAAAAVVLMAPAGHADRTYDLTGPAPLSYADIAQVFGQVVGRPVRYVDVPVDQARAGMLGEGMPDWLVDAVLDLAAFYRTGAASLVSGDVERLTGRGPRSVEDFIRDHPAVFAAV
jgi:uncharacterized protein YbjT (DUF2867 family)